jgi:hypothetical protein
MTIGFYNVNINADDTNTDQGNIMMAFCDFNGDTL